MKLFHKHQKEERNKLQDKAPSHELSKFDKAKKEYLDMYEGCEDDTFSVKIHYVSGAISLLENMRQKDLIWFLTCCKEKIGSATYWNSKHNADLLVDFGYVTFIEVSKEDQDD